MTTDDTTLGDGLAFGTPPRRIDQTPALGDRIRRLRISIREDLRADLAAQADALTAALREAREERHDLAIRVGEANRRTNKAEAEVERLTADRDAWRRFHTEDMRRLVPERDRLAAQVESVRALANDPGYGAIGRPLARAIRAALDAGKEE